MDEPQHARSPWELRGETWKEYAARMTQEREQRTRKQQEALTAEEKHNLIRRGLTNKKVQALIENGPPADERKGLLPDKPLWYGQWPLPSHIASNHEGGPSPEEFVAVFEPHRQDALAALRDGGTRRLREEEEALDQMICEVEAEIEQCQACVPDLVQEEYLDQALYYVLGDVASVYALPGREQDWAALHARRRHLLRKRDEFLRRRSVFRSERQRRSLGLPGVEVLYAAITPSKEELEEAYREAGVSLKREWSEREKQVARAAWALIDYREKHEREYPDHEDGGQPFGGKDGFYRFVGKKSGAYSGGKDYGKRVGIKILQAVEIYKPGTQGKSDGLMEMVQALEAFGREHGRIHEK